MVLIVEAFNGRVVLKGDLSLGKLADRIHWNIGGNRYIIFLSKFFYLPVDQVKRLYALLLYLPFQFLQIVFLLSSWYAAHYVDQIFCYFSNVCHSFFPVFSCKLFVSFPHPTLPFLIDATIFLRNCHTSKFVPQRIKSEQTFVEEIEEMIELKIRDAREVNENMLNEDGAWLGVDLNGFDFVEFGFEDGHGSVLPPLDDIFQLNELVMVL